MAEVFLARSRGVGGFEKLLVVKRMRPDYASDRAFVDMFLDEARIAATLEHTNVVQVYDAGQDGGRVFMAMEFLHGHDLRTLMHRAADRREPIPLDQAIGIIAGVCQGLHYAHE